jgi:hypothetical protein
VRPDNHELYVRRRSRNLGLALVLGAFALLTFAVTVVKLTDGEDLHLDGRSAAPPAAER